MPLENDYDIQMIIHYTDDIFHVYTQKLISRTHQIYQISGFAKFYSAGEIDTLTASLTASIFTIEMINTTYPRKFFFLQFEPLFFEQHASP